MYSSDYSSLGAFLGGFLLISILVFLAIYVFLAIIEYKVFKKADKPGWAAFVPVYNVIVLLDIIGYKWYYIFAFALSGVPIIGSLAVLLFTISLNIKLAKSFNQSTGFGIGLAFLNPIFMAIIAFSKEINYAGPTVNGDIDFKDLF